MNAEARTWNVGGILMYVAGALFLVRAMGDGGRLAVLACFLLTMAGGLFLLAGQRAVQRT